MPLRAAMKSSFRSGLSLLILPLTGLAFAGLAGACSSTTNTATDDTTPAVDAGSKKTDAGSKADSGSISTTTPASGKDLVAQNKCADCHTGSAGELAGSDKAIPGTQQFGANITPDKDTGIGDWTDDQIKTALTQGTDDQGAELCPKMPKFTELTDSDISAIVSYLRSLPAVSHAAPESVCPPIKSGDGSDDAGPTQTTDSGTPTTTGDASVPDDASVPGDAGPTTSGDAGASCSDYADPTTTAACVCDSTLHTCQANGCYNGYFCLTTTNKCRASKPSNCP